MHFVAEFFTGLDHLMVTIVIIIYKLVNLEILKYFMDMTEHAHFLF